MPEGRPVLRKRSPDGGRPREGGGASRGSLGVLRVRRERSREGGGRSPAVLAKTTPASRKLTRRIGRERSGEDVHSLLSPIEATRTETRGAARKREVRRMVRSDSFGRPGRRGFGPGGSRTGPPGPSGSGGHLVRGNPSEPGAFGPSERRGAACGSPGGGPPPGDRRHGTTFGQSRGPPSGGSALRGAGLRARSAEGSESPERAEASAEAPSGLLASGPARRERRSVRSGAWPIPSSSSAPAKRW